MIDWPVIGALAGAGLFVLFCGIYGRGADGRFHVDTGIGMVGASLVLTIGKAGYGLGQILHWWA